MTGPSSNRDKVEESSLVGWVIPRLSFLRVLVRHYVVTEVHFGEFLEALFKRYDRYVRERGCSGGGVSCAHFMAWCAHRVMGDCDVPSLIG